MYWLKTILSLLPIVAITGYGLYYLFTQSNLTIALAFTLIFILLSIVFVILARLAEIVTSIQEILSPK